MEIRRFWALIRKWWWLGLVCMVLGAGAALIVSLNTTPKYVASATLYVDTGSKQSTTTDMYGTELFLSQNVETLAERLVLRPVLQGVIENLGLDITADDLDELIATRVTQRTQLIVLEVTDVNPARAAAIANEIPTVFNLRNRALLSERYESSKSSIAAQMTTIESEMNQLQAQLDAQRNAAVPDNAEIARLENTLTQLRNTHAGLLQSYESIRMSELGALSNIVVDEPATAPTKPSSPNTPRTVGLAGVVGLMIAIGVACLIEYLDDTLKSPDEVEEALQLPVLAAIVEHDSTSEDIENGLIATAETRSAVKEAFRILRTSVQFAGLDQPVRSLVITSASPSEGKSTITANLGAAMAQAGQSVIVVDADLRRPRLHKLLHLSNERGLTTVLVNDSKNLDDVLQSTSVPNMRVLTAGPLPPDPTIVLNSHQMAELEKLLKERADIVLFDTPPTLMVADTVILGNRVDGVLLVTESGKTRRDLAIGAMEHLLQAGSRLLGAVVNRVPQKANGYYYYYSTYYQEGGGRAGEAPAEAKEAGVIATSKGRKTGMLRCRHQSRVLPALVTQAI